VLDFMTFLAAHSGEILGILAALHGLAVAVVNLTPTPKDDAIVAKAYRVIEVLAGILVPSKAKQ